MRGKVLDTASPSMSWGLQGVPAGLGWQQPGVPQRPQSRRHRGCCGQCWDRAGQAGKAIAAVINGTPAELTARGAHDGREQLHPPLPKGCQGLCVPAGLREPCCCSCRGRSLRSGRGEGPFGHSGSIAAFIKLIKQR